MFELFPSPEAPDYKMIFYDKHFKILREVSYDHEVVSLIIKRLLKEAFLDIDSLEDLAEPWYNIESAEEEPRSTAQPSPNIEIIPIFGDKFVPAFNNSSLKVNPDCKIRSFHLTFYNIKDLVYEGWFDTETLFRSSAEFILRHLIKGSKVSVNDSPFYYEVAYDLPNDSDEKKMKITSSTNLFQTFYPKSKGAFRLPKLEKERPRIQFKKLEIAPLPLLDPDRFSKTVVKGSRGKAGIGRVILHRQVYESLVNELRLSQKAENGGYLLGFAYRLAEGSTDEANPDFRWAIEVTDAIKSREAKGNAVILMFTHDSWSEIKRKIDHEHHGKQLVSWFHTHLFPASDTFGLSGLDQKLHRHFFTKPWQVALLLNIDRTGKRELRCFQLNSRRSKLIETIYEVLEV